jgi:hypothetical protein
LRRLRGRAGRHGRCKNIRYRHITKRGDVHTDDHTVGKATGLPGLINASQLQVAHLQGSEQSARLPYVLLR